ncbi:germination protein [Anaerocolumna cellulosilytica]|uniref:Germination protein n=1 Tax=Anaerocolumna cellulosilytica TaxID=433286 RepID=A0A6S6QTX5_9FIRM|nr:LysM peptidoglycan-binding domain-containing protein [Anaerocolumna cellulosilytica]MBB5196132.1 spore germination protein [Anaerocolumna cellulosilytica]BCJ92549.1 germination protein [Anaerocolumna cellulosilytica]
MNIHIVQFGDTIYTIADRYGVSPERIIVENDIMHPDNLTMGEALIIIRPNQTYIVQEGDSLESIAITQGVDVMELLRNNPNVSNRELYIGEEVVLSYIDSRTVSIKTNGFAYPFIDRATLLKTLPYLTYLTIYSYQIAPDGTLIDMDDSEIVQIAKEYGVAPIMFITAPHEGDNVDMDVAHILITNIEIQNKFYSDILTILRDKGYYGINIDTPYIQPEDRQPYVDFIANITECLNGEGYPVTVSIAPSTFEVSTGIIYNGVDYTGLSQAANDILYRLTYAFRYPQILPISTLPFDAVMQTVAKAMELIPPNKCMLDISVIGYLWEFPYFAAIIYVNFLNYNAAIELANNTSSIIQFNEPSRSSYFQYTENKHEYMAWFKDSRVIYPMLEYMRGYGLQGISIWNIMSFITSIWLMIQTQYEIEKIELSL